MNFNPTKTEIIKKAKSRIIKKASITLCSPLLIVMLAIFFFFTEYYLLFTILLLLALFYLSFVLYLVICRIRCVGITDFDNDNLVIAYKQLEYKYVKYFLKVAKELQKIEIEASVISKCDRAADYDHRLKKEEFFRVAEEFKVLEEEEILEKIKSLS